MSEGPASFTMLGGEGVVCEGDVCFVPGVTDAGAEPGAVPSAGG
ncbi:hypothetical protein EV187_2222 [Agromyces ramosus]|uniref:Uncharacterized protein n=1 Tax=Agromyces ramosus TaxID=33879 RepID=A0A4Q7MEC4_9MICO|nr:hypothetical protein [Agromyces ramosus]RZS66486.1 hypothetical protein EV187_2222 [Agromyces ramosus]